MESLDLGIAAEGNWAYEQEKTQGMGMEMDRERRQDVEIREAQEQSKASKEELHSLRTESEVVAEVTVVAQEVAREVVGRNTL